MIEIHVTHGDITTIACDAIVNAANSSLLGGGGVDGAIHRAAGPDLLAECRAVVARQGGCAPGEAVITGAGNLDADYVIHTVGPVWDEGQGDRLDPLLASCYARSVWLAHEHDVTKLAFPNISTGVYRYPQQRAAQVAVRAVETTLDALPSDTSLQAVLFCCFEADNFALYTELLG